METKQCCADFYQDDKIRLIFGESMHPGGLKLTKELGEMLGISEGKKVLDIASGYGVSAILLAKNFGCKVDGIDLAEKNVDIATKASDKVSELVNFKLGDAEDMDFEEESFDYAISECSFCLFPDKHKASKEMYRVLKVGGKLGMSDVVVRGQLQDTMKNTLYKFICIQDAKSEREYKDILESAGFENFYFEDKKIDILELLGQIRKKIFILEMAKGLDKIKIDIDLDDAKRILKEIKECVDKGTISYGLMTAEKN